MDPALRATMIGVGLALIAGAAATLGVLAFRRVVDWWDAR